MILHPGIIGLIAGGLLCLLMVGYGSFIGALILKGWDYSSSSEYQLGLERKTYLVSTIVQWALWFQVISLILFVYTMDDIHELFVGAMCATGSLNANPVGWYGLLVKIISLFGSSFWLLLNSLDQRLETMPFVRLKYGLLFGIIPLIFADVFLQLSYFTGLEPAMITSCCGSLFGSDSATTLSTVAAFPVGKTMLLFYLGSIFHVFFTALLLRSNVKIYRLLTLVIAGLYLCIGVISIISFVSIYVYELPTHHCPFDMLQGWYNYIGYPIYIFLFLSVFYGMGPGLFLYLRKTGEADQLLGKEERKWACATIASTLCLVTLVSYVILSSNLSYFSG